MKEVFLSSTSQDLEPFRDAVYAAIESLDGYHCVRMEDFGARDGKPEDFCRAAVAKCDVYVGLVGHLYGTIPDGYDKSHTELEYDAAIEANKPRLVFLASEKVPLAPSLVEKDDKQKRLAAFRKRIDSDRIREAFETTDGLRSSVIQAIFNWQLRESSIEELEALEAWKTAALDLAVRASEARCAVRWEAAGVPRAEAETLASEKLIGSLPDGVKPKPGGVLGIVGQLGMGKSLGAERLFQQCLDSFRHDSSSPMPCYLEARSLEGPLRAAVEAETVALGKLSIQGVFVVLDGLDERDPATARAMLDELRVLVRSAPNSGAVVTTRPITNLLREAEAYDLDLLSEEEALLLLSRFAGQELSYFLHDWPESVKEAIRRPLFAVVLGRHIALYGMAPPTSVGEMIQGLVRRLLNEVRLDPIVVEPLLRKLAVLRVDGGEPVSSDQLRLGTHADLLLQSRLVVTQGGKVDFSLQILTEWFAAEALLRDEVSIITLVQEPGRLERWRYAITVAVSFGDESASRLLPVLVKDQPAFAARLVEMVEPQTNNYEGAAVTVEDGSKIRSAMENWLTGIAQIAPMIAPLKRDGSLGSLGYSVGVGGCTTSWYMGEDIEGEVFDLSANVDLVKSQEESVIRSGRSSGKPAWPWLWALDDLSTALADVMTKRSLPVVEGPIHVEAMWELALATCGHGSLSHEPVRIDQLEAEIEALADQTLIKRAGTPAVQVSVVRRLIELLTASGQKAVLSPWPRPDREYGKGWVWDPYSDDRLLERTQAIYSAALESYEALVAAWFPRFTPWLRKAATLPARLTGFLEVAKPGSGTFGGPSILWYLEPLSLGSASSVDIVPGSKRLDEVDFDPLLDLYRHLRKDSPGASPVVHSSVLDIFGATPVTEIVYGWLWEDLTEIGWLEGMFHRRY